MERWLTTRRSDGLGELKDCSKKLNHFFVLRIWCHFAPRIGNRRLVGFEICLCWLVENQSLSWPPRSSSGDTNAVEQWYLAVEQGLVPFKFGLPAHDKVRVDRE